MRFFFFFCKRLQFVISIFYSYQDRRPQHIQNNGSLSVKLIRDTFLKNEGGKMKWFFKRLNLFIIILIISAGSSFAKTTELTFWTFQQLHAEFMEKQVKKWNIANPGNQIELKSESMPYGEMHTNLLVSMTSGVGGPDMADIELGQFPNFLRGKKLGLIPLNDIIDTDKFVKARLDIYSKNGQYYGAPYHVGLTVVYYNVDILAKAGVDPNKILTWNDFMAAGKKVSDKTDAVMTTLEVTEWGSLYPMVSQQGSDWMDANGKLTLTDEANIRALTLQRKMIDSGIAISTPGGFHHAEEYWGFMNAQKAAAVWMPLWYMGRFTDSMPDLKGKIMIRPMPAFTSNGKRTAGMGGTGTVITAQSKHQKLAKDFLAFAKLSKQANIDIWNMLGFDPPRHDVWDSLSKEPSNKFTEYFVNNFFDVMIEIKNEVNPIYPGKYTPKLWGQLPNNAIFQVLEEKSMSPQQALKKLVLSFEDK